MDKKVKVEIYGAGCDKYFQTVDSFKKAVRKCGAGGKVEEITDGKQIAARGIVNMPAVFVNEKLMVQGEGISEERAEELLRAEV